MPGRNKKGHTYLKKLAAERAAGLLSICHIFVTATHLGVMLAEKPYCEICYKLS